MIGKFSVTNPDTVEFTLTVTMPLRDWKRLKDQLTGSLYPTFKFYDAIVQMISKASEQYSEDVETDVNR